jgi:hypothetical protein
MLARPSIGVTVRGRLAALDRLRSARPRLSRHGAVAQYIVSPRGHEPWLAKRYRAVSPLDDGLEHVIRFTIKRDGRVRVRLDVDIVELLFSALYQHSQFVRRPWTLKPIVEPVACVHVAKQEVADLLRRVFMTLPIQFAPSVESGAWTCEVKTGLHRKLWEGQRALSARNCALMPSVKRTHPAPPRYRHAISDLFGGVARLQVAIDTYSRGRPAAK